MAGAALVRVVHGREGDKRLGLHAVQVVIQGTGGERERGLKKGRERHEKTESTGDQAPAGASESGGQLFAQVAVPGADGAVQHRAREEADPSEGRSVKWE